MGTTLERKPIRVVARRADRASAFRVDYYANRTDFLCVLYAACGIETGAIADMLKMTPGRVAYRITKYERGRRRKDPTVRKLFRLGKSPIARSLISQASKNASLASKTVQKQLDNKGLFTPIPTGVLTNESRLNRKR